jgi:hypothetical protein
MDGQIVAPKSKSSGSSATSKTPLEWEQLSEAGLFLL